jgi:hypothetical protein
MIGGENPAVAKVNPRKSIDLADAGEARIVGGC